MELIRSQEQIREALAAAPTGLCAGQWRPASDGSTFQVLDPSNGEVLARVANATAVDATTCIDQAEAALPAWSARSPRDRSELLMRAYGAMLDQAELLATLIVLENGKAWPDAVGEVRYAAEYLRWYAEEAVRDRGFVMTAPSGDNRIVVLHQPIGIAVLVSPWNFPAAMLTRKIAPAIGAGCTVLCKPAKETPLTALAMVKIFQDAGVPEGVINIAPTFQASSVVSTWLEDPRVRKLSFTGSTEVGRMLLAQASQRVVKCSMELGGNAPFVVLDDADIDAAVAGAMIAKMRNMGEACTAANRFYVDRAVVGEFTDKLTHAMAGLKMGPGLGKGVELGPLVNQDGQQKVAALVRDAIERGAKVRTGGRIPEGKGWYYEATVLTDVPQDAEILNNEIFGPVAPIVAVDGEEEAIGLANDCEMGLVSYLYTGDLSRGMRLSEALQSGMVGLNRGLVSDPAAPFGGSKQSGIGREGAYEGMQEYVEQKYIAVTW
ncbi:MAG: NAD-dependent succinate-semialdehyde dehydrogenase [Bifidobacteriaceae bacterium]|nr:NAD-dependent succinate-semialdehyde dehydrogenase [Bifidobacteriaceae bacterium]